MPLTPSDVEKTTFSTALRGYDLNEVDDFLDQVVVAIRDLEGDLSEAKTSLAGAESDGTPASGADEATLGRALLAAQQVADKLIEDATVESDRVREDANVESAELLENAEVKPNPLRSGAQSVRNRRRPRWPS